MLIVVGFVTGLGSDGGRLALLFGLVLASLGGLDTALREHFAGFRSHSSVLAGLPAVLVAGGLFFGRAPWAAVVAGGAVTFAAAFWWFRPRSAAGRVDCRSAERRLPRVSEERRLQLRGLHHVTAICRDLEATIAFYRDVMGLGIVHDGPSDDDPGTRHVWFGALDGAAGTLLSFMEYPQLPKGVVGVGSTHHFALVVESAEELEAWRDYLRGKELECTDVYDRGAFKSVYLRDPDGHVVEIATRGPGFTPGPR